MKFAGQGGLHDQAGMPLIVRTAQPEDVMNVFRWRNDPLVRSMSRDTKPISEQIHKEWYSRAIDDPRRLLLIGVRGGQKIGMVRFDQRQTSSWEVSIMVAPEARGQGMGRHLLRMSLERLRALYAPTCLLASIRLKNQPSLMVFHALGFRQQSSDGEFVTLTLAAD
jgi:L-amino acid N-acyltransferase YncA